MKRLPWILSLVLAAVSQAQTPCIPNAFPQAARQALSLQKELQQIKSSDGDDEVVPAASGKITQLKDALSLATDAAMACEQPSVSTAELQLRMARVLHANQPQPAETPSGGTINRDVAGLYGTDLELKVRRTPEIAGLIGIEYSIDAGCGVDTMLLIYELRESLQKVHDSFDPKFLVNDKEYVSHALGPVRACKDAGVFQVQIDSTLEKIVVGKPGGDSEPLPSRYFHVREAKDGYQMLSAHVEPDPACSGPDLMPPAVE